MGVLITVVPSAPAVAEPMLTTVFDPAGATGTEVHRLGGPARGCADPDAIGRGVPVAVPMVAVAPEAVSVPEKVFAPVKVCVPARIASSLEVFGQREGPGRGSGSGPRG